MSTLRLPGVVPSQRNSKNRKYPFQITNDTNIPIVKDRPLPDVVRRLPMKKVGFLMNVERLSSLRAERVGRMACAQIPGYSSKAYILEELEYCESLYRTVPGLWTVNVTNRSIEETSEWITRNVL